MNALSSRLWSEFDSFDVIHIHQSLTDFGAYASCVAASLGKTVVLTDSAAVRALIMLQGGLAMADGVVPISRYAHSFIAPLVRAPSAILIGPVNTDIFSPLQWQSVRQPLCVSAGSCLTRA